MPPSIVTLLLVASFFSTLNFASLLISTGSTIELAGIPYYVPANSFASIPSAFYAVTAVNEKSLGTRWIPVTVLKVTTATVSTTELQRTLNSYQNIDDVWNVSFLAGQLLKALTRIISGWFLTFEQVFYYREG